MNRMQCKNSPTHVLLSGAILKPVWQLQAKLPMLLEHSCEQLPLCMAHSLISAAASTSTSIIIIIIIITLQAKLPMLLEHSCEQLPLCMAHSLISAAASTSTSIIIIIIIIIITCSAKSKGLGGLWYSHTKQSASKPADSVQFHEDICLKTENAFQALRNTNHNYTMCRKST